MAWAAFFECSCGTWLRRVVHDRKLWPESGCVQCSCLHLARHRAITGTHRVRRNRLPASHISPVVPSGASARQHPSTDEADGDRFDGPTRATGSCAPGLRIRTALQGTPQSVARVVSPSSTGWSLHLRERLFFFIAKSDSSYRCVVTRYAIRLRNTAKAASVDGMLGGPRRYPLSGGPAPAEHESQNGKNSHAAGARN